MNRTNHNLVSLAIEPILPSSTSVQKRMSRRIWSVRSRDGDIGYVVKFYKGTDSGFMREIIALRDINRADLAFRIPVLSRHGVLSNTPTAFVVMDELSGRTLDSIMRRGRLEREVSFSMIGHVLSEFHKLTPPNEITDKHRVNVVDSLIAACDAHIRILESRGELNVADRARSTRHRLERSSYSPDGVVFCHGDLHPKNLIINMRNEFLSFEPGLVDFESVRIQAREFDIAKSIVVSGATNQGDVAAIIEGYGNRKLDERMLALYQAFHAIDGWVYGCLTDRRDRVAWHQRLLRYVGQLQS